MSLIECIDFSSLGDNRGSLVSLESNKNIPFDIKRVYYIFNTKMGISRGYHAHKELKQVAICLSGQCKITLDNGENRESVLLDNPKKGLLIGDMIWREMHEFSEGCVLLILASEHYNELDYIRNYEEFLELIQ